MKNGNCDTSTQSYHLNMHDIAGASPSCSNDALQNTAPENDTKYGTEFAETLTKNFYVDDMLKSVSNEKTGIKVIQSVRKICADGGFHLTRFVSNKMQVLASIPEEECRKGVLDQVLKFGMLPREKALGIYWNNEEDKIDFSPVKILPNLKIREIPNIAFFVQNFMRNSIVDLVKFSHLGKKSYERKCRGEYFVQNSIFYG